MLYNNVYAVMKRSQLFIILSLFFTVTLFGQNKEAKNMLDQISKRYEAYTSIDMRFDLTIAYPERPVQRQTARIVQKGNQFVFFSESQDIYGDGRDVWLHLKDRDEVQLNNYDDEDDLGLMTPRDLLKQYQSDQFDYDLVNKTDQHLFIEFKPLSRESEYSKYRVQISKRNNDFEKVEAFGKDGSKITVVLAEIDTNQSYENNFFKFDTAKNPEVYIEDLRID